MKIKDLGMAKDHDPRSKAIYDFLDKTDFENGDRFVFKSGGDGDNGEVLMDYLDAYFKTQDEFTTAQINDTYAYLGCIEGMPEKGTILFSAYDPHTLKAKLESQKGGRLFINSDSTSWGGYDDVNRMLNIHGWSQKDVVCEHLSKPLIFDGVDCDHVIKRNWTIKVDTVYTLKKNNA